MGFWQHCGREPLIYFLATSLCTSGEGCLLGCAPKTCGDREAFLGSCSVASAVHEGSQIELILGCRLLGHGFHMLAQFPLNPYVTSSFSLLPILERQGFFFFNLF